jgi:peptidoglycan/LPS O-acetylase OafA/YrhL
MNLNQKQHFYFLDALRGIAALWVIFYHSRADIPSLAPVLPEWIKLPLFEWGSYGVAVFFVLSGFVIAHSTRSATVTFAYFKQFSIRRFIRLTPPYYASILFTIAIAWIAAMAKKDVLAPMGQALSIQRLLAHLTYGQELLGFININDVYWTLCLEVQFYLVFCAVLGLAQHLTKRFPQSNPQWIWVANAAIAIPFAFGLGYSGRAFFFLQAWYSFLLGVFSYWAWTRKISLMSFYGYAGLILIAGIIRSDGFVLTVALTAIALLEVGRANRMHWLNWGWLQYLGKISYSVYLFHVPIVGGVLFVVQKLFGPSLLADLLFVAGGLIGSLGVGAIFWWLTEKPAIALSRKLGQTKSEPALALTK